MLPRETKRKFAGGAKSGEISFYPLEAKPTTFSAENLIGNVNFQNPGRTCPGAPPLPTPMIQTCVRDATFIQ